MLEERTLSIKLDVGETTVRKLYEPSCDGATQYLFFKRRAAAYYESEIREDANCLR